MTHQQRIPGTRKTDDAPEAADTRETNLFLENTARHLLQPNVIAHSRPQIDAPDRRDEIRWKESRFTEAKAFVQRRRAFPARKAVDFCGFISLRTREAWSSYRSIGKIWKTRWFRAIKKALRRGKWPSLYIRATGNRWKQEALVDNKFGSVRPSFFFLYLRCGTFYLSVLIEERLNKPGFYRQGIMELILIARVD